MSGKKLYVVPEAIMELKEELVKTNKILLDILIEFGGFNNVDINFKYEDY